MMNPHHLESDELNYELEIRNIRDIVGQDNKRRALRRRLKDEHANPMEFPHVSHGEEMLSGIGEKIEEIQSILASAVKSNNKWLVETLESRCLHLKNRLGRVELKTEIYFDIYKTYQTTVKKFLDVIRSFSEKSQVRTGHESLPIPSDSGNQSATGTVRKRKTLSVPQTANILTSSRNESVGAEGLAYQAHSQTVSHTPKPTQPIAQGLTEQEQKELDAAHKLIESLNQKSKERNMSSLLINMSDISLNEPIQSMHEPIRNARPPFSSDSEEEVVVQVPNPRAQVPRIPAQPQIPVQYIRRGLPVSRWALKFSGDHRGLQLPDFLNQIEIMATAEGATDEDLHRSAIYLLDGFAKTWYMAFRNNYPSWNRLVDGLRVQFLPKDWDYWQLKDIENRYQREDESFGVFLASMVLKFQELPYEVREDQKVAIIRRNLLPAYQDRLALVDTNTLYQLNYACDRIEQSQYASIRRPQFPIATVNPVQPKPQHEFRTEPTNQKPGANLRCFNCGTQGHHFNDCQMKRKKFCYRCGKPDTISFECDCNAGNGKDPRF